MTRSRFLAAAIFLFVLLLCRPAFGTVWDGCYADMSNHSSTLEGMVNVDGHQVTNFSDAAGYTYGFCLSRCTKGSEPFNWPEFNQQFTEWALPWLALISQLPYGANDALSNFEAMILTVGSPMLAAYSLALAVTSKRWMIKRFQQSGHPRTFMAAKFLSNLQQVSFTLPKAEDVVPSLIMLPENDEWWARIDEGLDYAGPRWTLAAIMSMTYVGLAYTFTWVSTLQGDLTPQVYASGQSVGSLWLSLLPIVFGYLRMSPKCEAGRVRKAVDSANKFLYVSSDSGSSEQVPRSRAITVHTSTRDPVYEDQICSTPLCYYARASTWLEAAREVTDAFEAASENDNNKEKGTPNPRTKAEVVQWCTLLAPQAGGRVHEFFTVYVEAALLGAFLQWGTTCSAIVALILTPTRGLGCRSMSFILYGTLSTIVWLLMIISNACARSYTTSKECGKSTGVTHSLVIIFRQAAKTLALVNSAGVILSTLFQFSNVYDNCYCNSSKIGLGKHAYIVLQLSDAMKKNTKFYWAAGMIMSSATALLFILVINLLIKNPERRTV